MRNNKGYSIAETLVVVFIVATIAGLVLTNYRAGERSSNLNYAADKLASDIRLAQNYAMSQKEYKGLLSREGWGLYLNITDNTSYIIYSEQAGSKYQYDGDYNDEGYMQAKLPIGTVIDSIDLGGAVNALSIGFEPPDPATYFNNDSSTNNIATIILRDTRTNSTKTVIVNLFGLIDVD